MLSERERVIQPVVWEDVGGLGGFAFAEADVVVCVVAVEAVAFEDGEAYAAPVAVPVDEDSCVTPSVATPCRNRAIVVRVRAIFKPRIIVTTRRLRH